MLVLSAFFGGLSGWMGASLSALAPGLPSGALIVLVATAGFLLSLVLAWSVVCSYGLYGGKVRQGRELFCNGVVCNR